MKTCTKCQLPKSDEEFAFRNKLKGIKQSFCKACRKEVDAEIWNRDPAFRQKKVERQKSYKTRNQEFLIEYLSQHPCVDCGESDPVVLEFDHLHDKRHNVSAMVDGTSLEGLKTEIAKCQIRCANCHRRKTAQQFGYRRFKITGKKA